MGSTTEDAVNVSLEFLNESLAAVEVSQIPEVWRKRWVRWRDRWLSGKDRSIHSAYQLYASMCEDCILDRNLISSDFSFSIVELGCKVAQLIKFSEEIGGGSAVSKGLLLEILPLAQSVYDKLCGVSR